MIRKLKNILSSKENFVQYEPPSCAESAAPVSSGGIIFKSNALSSRNLNSSNGSSPVNYIRKKIRSSKSWAKLPKTTTSSSMRGAGPSYDDESSAYESISSMEPANHEFETYTRHQMMTMITNANAAAAAALVAAPQNQPHNKAHSLDYGFESSSNNSTSPLNSDASKVGSSVSSGGGIMAFPNQGYPNKIIKLISPGNILGSSSASWDSQPKETALYRRLLEKLQKSSIDAPANIPLLCVETFARNDPNWLRLTNRLSSSGINVRLVELTKGVPLNALFYLSDLDMIYVRSYNLNGDDLEGYVPRLVCKPFNTVDIGVANDENGLSAPGDHESIKYHSLSTTSLSNIGAKENDGEENQYSHIVEVASGVRKSSEDIECEENERRRVHDCLTYELASNSRPNQAPLPPVNYTQFQTASSCFQPIGEVRSINYNANNNQLGSLIRSSFFNLGSIDEASAAFFNNFTYNSPAPALPQQPHKSANKHVRRSLDSTTTTSVGRPSHLTTTPTAANKLFSVSIELDEANNSRRSSARFASKTTSNDDIDLRKIEMDSIRGDELHDTTTVPSTTNAARDDLLDEDAKVWTVILKHVARNFQEINVEPGMMVRVIKEYGEWIYVKLVGFERSNLELSQQYGMIPRSCAIDLHEIIYKGAMNLNSGIDAAASEEKCSNNRRKSQITAL